MKNDFDKLISAILLVIILPYGIFNIYRYFSNPYTIMVAYSHYEDESFNLKGMVLRDEVVIQHETGDNCYYIRQDGDLVGFEQEILRIYGDGNAIESLTELENLQDEILGLKEASALENQYLAAEQIKGHINNQVSEVYHAAVTGNLSDISSVRKELTALINKRMVATGRESSFAGRIALLEQRKAQLESSISAPSSQIIAPQVGYFASTADGFEGLYPAKNREHLDFNQLYQEIDNMGTIPFQSVTARLVTDHNWYLAVILPNDIVESFEINRGVSMDFGAAAGTVKGVISGLRSEGDRHIAFIQCGIITPDLIRLRKVDVNITFRGFEGLMVNKEALRYNEQNEAGVYVIQGGTIQFRRIEIVYQNDSYMLCKENSELPNSLTLFDEVIIKGKDAYHGKVLTKW